MFFPAAATGWRERVEGLAVCGALRRQRGQRPGHRHADRPHQDITPGEKNAVAVRIRRVLTLCCLQLFNAYRVNRAHYPPKREKRELENVFVFIRREEKKNIDQGEIRDSVSWRFPFLTHRCAKSAAHLRFFLFLFSASTRGCTFWAVDITGSGPNCLKL